MCSTTTHNASPGDVDEGSFDGCCANQDTTVSARLTGMDEAGKRGFAGSSNAARNPGGSMGVWAEENDRDSLLNAMQRREVFATSGPRLIPRFFVGKNIPEDICAGEFSRQGYENGVPMGGVVQGLLAVSPVFAAAVTADPQGNRL